MSFLSVSQLTKLRNEVASVNAISFALQRGERIAIVGETGSGKTSLLKMIGGLLQPDAGEIYLNGSPVLGPLYQLIPGHKDIGYMSQHFELLNHYKVREVLEMQARCSESDLGHIAETCHITHLLGRRTDALSGGERQRIALAQQLIKQPKLMLLDEPFSNLDFPNRQMIKQALASIAVEKQISFIWVSHDASDVLSWADRMFVMLSGNFLQEGSPFQLYHHPVNPYTAGLLGDFNTMHLPDGGTAMIRPEHIEIIPVHEAQQTGVVAEMLFCGDHHVLLVHMNHEVLRVKTNRSDFSVGDQVGLHWPQAHLHRFAAN